MSKSLSIATSSVARVDARRTNPAGPGTDVALLGRCGDGRLEQAELRPLVVGAVGVLAGLGRALHVPGRPAERGDALNRRLDIVDLEVRSEPRRAPSLMHAACR